MSNIVLTLLVQLTDKTRATGCWQFTPDGLFPLGHRQDHRPDWPQVKVMLGVLDPSGMPVATRVVAAQRADDPLDVPAIARVRPGVGRRGWLYVGDCQIGALHTRAVLPAGDALSRMLLSARPLPETEWHAYLPPIWMGEPARRLVYRPRADGLPERIAEGFERVATIPAELPGSPLGWSERGWVVRSLRAQCVWAKCAYGHDAHVPKPKAKPSISGGVASGVLGVATHCVRRLRRLGCAHPSREYSS
jgi:hypothetical protein